MRENAIFWENILEVVFYNCPFLEVNPGMFSSRNSKKGVRRSSSVGCVMLYFKLHLLRRNK